MDRGVQVLDSERGDKGEGREDGGKEGRRQRGGKEGRGGRDGGRDSWRGAHREKRNEGMVRVLTLRTHGQFAQREKICIEQFSLFSPLSLPLRT